MPDRHTPFLWPNTPFLGDSSIRQFVKPGFDSHPTGFDSHLRIEPVSILSVTNRLRIETGLTNDPPAAILSLTNRNPVSILSLTNGFHPPAAILSLTNRNPSGFDSSVNSSSRFVNSSSRFVNSSSRFRSGEVSEVGAPLRLQPRA